MSVTKDLNYYLSLPYTIILKRDEEGDFVGRIEELERCIAHGSNEAEAVEHLRGMQALWIQDCLESEQPVPEPNASEDPLPSGKWVQRVPRTLHQRLTIMAKREGVSLNQLVMSMLTEALAVKTVSRDPVQHVVFAANRLSKSVVVNQWECGRPLGAQLVFRTEAAPGRLLSSLRNLRTLYDAGQEGSFEWPYAPKITEEITK